LQAIRMPAAETSMAHSIIEITHCKAAHVVGVDQRCSA